MCAHKTQSKFRCRSFQDIQNFKWTELLNEHDLYTPTLASVLRACTVTKHLKSNRTAIICVCAGYCLSFTSPHVNLIQKMISFILHAGHCGKMHGMSKTV